MDEPVVLTGAGGRVGRAILEWIGPDYEWVLFDRRPPDVSELEDAIAKRRGRDDPAVDAEIVVGDVTDRDDVREAVSGAGAVIHLAGDPRPEAPWESVLENNVDGAQAVFQVAADEGVERVAFASSNHAVGAYETDARKPDLYRPADDYRLDGTELPRPGNLYGVSKATGEVLGRYYHDARDLSVVCVRIGNLTRDHPPAEYERGQAMWLSYRDCAHLFERCLEAEYGYEIVYGISDNERKYYSLERAREVLGYEPRDDSAEFTFEGEPIE